MRLLGSFLGFSAAAAISIHEVARWKVPEVGILTATADLPSAPGPAILGTSFGPLGTDQVFALTNLEARQGAKLEIISTDFAWPNEAARVPADVGLEGSLLTVAYGFFFPGKRDGGVSLINVTAGLEGAPHVLVSEVKDDYFYHHVQWLDVDGDGLKDIIAGRASKPLFLGSPTEDLVWIKNVGSGHFGETQVLTPGPGVYFAVADLDNDGKLEIVSAEYFAHQDLAVYSCDAGTWAECAAASGRSSSFKRTVLFSGEGPFFSCSVADLNGDGKLDILATMQQQPRGVTGRVLALEQPPGGTDGGWSTHILADGYLPHPLQQPGSGSPGVAIAFTLDAQIGGKPHILVSGDDGGMVDLLIPTSQESGNWTYDRQTIYTTTAKTAQFTETIGSPVVLDVDGNGRPELFIPSYADGHLIMFTFEGTTSLDFPGLPKATSDVTASSITLV